YSPPITAKSKDVAEGVPFIQAYSICHSDFNSSLNFSRASSVRHSPLQIFTLIDIVPLPMYKCDTEGNSDLLKFMKLVQHIVMVLSRNLVTACGHDVGSVLEHCTLIHGEICLYDAKLRTR
ncbi:hypothetical protein CUMW_270880, partial [Citrus unshiu]